MVVATGPWFDTDFQERVNDLRVFASASFGECLGMHGFGVQLFLASLFVGVSPGTGCSLCGTKGRNTMNPSGWRMACRKLGEWCGLRIRGHDP